MLISVFPRIFFGATGYTSNMPVVGPVLPEDMALRVREFSVVAEMLLFSGQYLDIVPEAQSWAVSVGHQKTDFT